MKDLITEARELCEKATPGPWYVHESHNWHKDQPKEYFVIARGSKEIVASWVEKADAAFIAHAREDIPCLLAHLAEQEKMHWVSVNAGADAIRQLKEWLAERDREIERLREAQRWIPVSERLPCSDVPVLVTYVGFTDNKQHSDGIAIWSPELNGYNGGWEWTLDYSEVTVEITHWLPLPDAPDEEHHETYRR